ncbi:MAG: hypothetical protein WBA66_02840 [Xanthobacteraceae bacterium]
MSWVSEAASSQSGATVLAGFVTLTVGLIASGVTLLIGWRQSTASSKAADAALLSARASGHRAIASMRLEWLSDLRTTISEYHSILMTAQTLNTSTLQKLSQLGTKLDLMLNTNNGAQKDLWEILDQLYKTDDLANRQKFDEPLMKAGRKVLKEEWERIKREARGEH